MKNVYTCVIPAKTQKIWELRCDNPNCRKLIQDNLNHKAFREGAFQCGLNSHHKIGTWCSEECFLKCCN